MNEKNLREHYIPNVCSSVVITTNHKTDGIFLPPDDRRHYVAWSALTEGDFDGDYWRERYRWYEDGGFERVAHYLANFDLGRFDPKAPPPKTHAFWEIVDANRSPEDAELADAIDALGSPNALTLEQIASCANSGLGEYLHNRKNARRIPHRLEACGYVAVRNEGAKDGHWKVEGRRQVIYAKAALPLSERLAVARELVRCR